MKKFIEEYAADLVGIVLTAVAFYALTVLVFSL